MARPRARQRRRDAERARRGGRAPRRRPHLGRGLGLRVHARRARGQRAAARAGCRTSTPRARPRCWRCAAARPSIRPRRRVRPALGPWVVRPLELMRGRALLPARARRRRDHAGLHRRPRGRDRARGRASRARPGARTRCGTATPVSAREFFSHHARMLGTDRPLPAAPAAARRPARRRARARAAAGGPGGARRSSRARRVPERARPRGARLEPGGRPRGGHAPHRGVGARVGAARTGGVIGPAPWRP